jgi:hypothetical protein
MAGRKPKPPGPPWQILLEEMRSQGILIEEMRSQNRATIEAVVVTRESLEQRFDLLDRRLEQVDQESRARDADLALAIRAIQADLRGLASRVEVIPRLEERVTAIEKRLG